MAKRKFDGLKDLTKKGQDLVAEHPDAVKEALRKATLAADRTTGGKFRQKLYAAEAKAAEFVDKQEFDKKLADAQGTHADADAVDEPPE